MPAPRAHAVFMARALKRFDELHHASESDQSTTEGGMAGKITKGAKRLWAHPHVQMSVKMFGSMLLSIIEGDKASRDKERELNPEQTRALKRGREEIAKEEWPHRPRD